MTNHAIFRPWQLGKLIFLFVLAKMFQLTGISPLKPWETLIRCHETYRFLETHLPKT